MKYWAWEALTQLVAEVEFVRQKVNKMEGWEVLMLVSATETTKQ